MKSVTGDLIALARAGEFDAIVHGCNCMCTMGAGIARGIREAFPAAYRADLATVRGDRAKLGACSYAMCEVDGGVCDIVNAYTQFDFRGAGVRVDYDAVRSCFAWVRENCAGRIGIPKIGAGLARGDWNRISKIIESELCGNDVTLVLWDGLK